MATLRARSFIRPPAACHFAAPVIEGLGPHNLHDHDFIELFWIEAGVGWHWINQSRRPLAKGSLIFVRASDRHSLSAQSTAHPLCVVNVAFARRTWVALRDRYELKDFFDPASRDPLELVLSSAQLALARGISADLRMGRLDRFATERFLLNLVHLIEMDNEFYRSSGPVPAWLGKILAALANPAHSNSPTSTQEIANLCGLTPEHVSRTFRRCLGKTPTDVLNHHKLSRAAARLASSADDILDIALDCGFANLSHFYRLFRRRYRTTPRRYRLEQQEIVRSPTNPD